MMPDTTQMTVRMDGEIMVLGVVIPSVGGDTADGVGVSEKERMKVGSVLAGPGGREGEREKGESCKSSEQQTSFPIHHVRDQWLWLAELDNK